MNTSWEGMLAKALNPSLWKTFEEIMKDLLQDYIDIVNSVQSHSKCWDTLTLSQASNYDGFALKIYLDHKFLWPQEGLNYESLHVK